MKRLLWLIFTLILTIPIVAQQAFTEYQWANGNLALGYPASWEEPLQRFSPEGDRALLMLAQIQVDSPEIRPPAIPFLTITVLRKVTQDDNLYAILEAELQTIDIEALAALPSALFSQEAIATFGTSRDAVLYGLGRIIYLDAERGGVMIYGRAALAQRDDFVALFNTVANSLTLSAGQSTLASQYGVLWQTSRSFVDGERAFLDIAGLALADDGTLYLADAFVGLVALDSSTGVVKSITAFADVAEPTDLAIAPDGSIYVADSLCGCIRIFREGIESSAIEGFGEIAPSAIVLAEDGTLYASDIVQNEHVIYGLGSDFDTILRFDEAPFEAPLLAIDRLGRLIALVDGQYIYALEENNFILQYELPSLVTATAISIDFQNNLIVATADEGILVFDSVGKEIYQLGRVVETEPQAGELFQPHGIASSSDGTIYWADSDGTFGNVTAMSLSVESGRVGSTNLLNGIEVQGLLEGNIKRQFWTFDAIVADIVTITALANESAFGLDISLRLLDPRGSEIIFVDNDEENLLLNPFDAQINNLTLQRAGQYIVIIESVAGTGRYRLGLSQSQFFEITENYIEFNASLSDVIPVQRWQFQGRGAQTLSLTMTAIDGTLDPMLRLLNPQGNLIAENDDADDFSLGFDSQLLDIRLPSNGRYTIEAIRFDGEGSYLLTIESN
jgi:sugar lactone lactonase YvrE